mmetsp:Transcript_25051/g.54508  ORF Transcript_25051/g.54508 Transcript_25051/m.54508 type:complete len:114 (-) Transcript_25051:58-399(-)
MRCCISALKQDLGLGRCIVRTNMDGWLPSPRQTDETLTSSIAQTVRPEKKDRVARTLASSNATPTLRAGTKQQKKCAAELACSGYNSVTDVPSRSNCNCKKSSRILSDKGLEA